MNVTTNEYQALLIRTELLKKRLGEVKSQATHKEDHHVKAEVYHVLDAISELRKQDIKNMYQSMKALGEHCAYEELASTKCVSLPQKILIPLCHSLSLSLYLCLSLSLFSPPKKTCCFCCKNREEEEENGGV